jgi:uncharacterized protein YyaL (SSP411 family)
MSTPALNSLARASSAYLRSAMHQPVQWHEWDDDAFAAAQRENKPILLDIGAVWCHWCHVMDRESYEDPEIAQILNERFIAVKVDRDERPDIDSRYQVAVSAISGQGGWPLTAFLTPDGKPFYGGTYFPPQDGYGRPSFRRVLTSIADAYRDKSGDVIEQAQMVESTLAQSESFSGPGGRFSPEVIASIVKSAVEMFDAKNGGFGQAPKFPHPSVLDLLMDQYVRSGDRELGEVIGSTLEKMARGGVYDQLAGGFHRYSVDDHWSVPHFEKMCYDNSELLKNYVHGHQATGSEFFAAVARDIIRWINEWLSDQEHGGFYASQDADISLDDDGDYFTWTLAEAQAVLAEEEAKVASLHYDINEVGEMHHNPEKNVLYVRASIEEIAIRTGIPRERVQALLQAAREKMYAARLQRTAPYVDKTVYVGWNCLCISAYLTAAKALGLEGARHFALRSMDRILGEGWNPDSGLLHVIAYSDASASHRQVGGMLDDYAFAVIACLDAYEATADLSYFNFAKNIADAMIARFFDQAGGGFWDTARAEKALGVLGTRRKPFQDSPTPAGNSVAAIGLMRLYGYTNDGTYRDRAEETIEVLAGVAGKYGIFAATYAIAAVHFSQAHTQVVIVGNDALADQLHAAAVKDFLLGKSVLRLQANQAVQANLPPALAATIPQLPAVSAGPGVAIVCSNFSCKPPISNPEELAAALNSGEGQSG